LLLKPLLLLFLLRVRLFFFRQRLDDTSGVRAS